MRKTRLLLVGLALTLSSVAYADRPPFTPHGRCEAQCLVEFRWCQRICSENPCFVACETVLEICRTACGTAS